jgi:hypothetical protein
MSLFENAYQFQIGLSKLQRVLSCIVDGFFTDGAAAREHWRQPQSLSGRAASGVRRTKEKKGADCVWLLGKWGQGSAIERAFRAA